MEFSWTSGGYNTLAASSLEEAYADGPGHSIPADGRRVGLVFDESAGFKRPYDQHVVREVVCGSCGGLAYAYTRTDRKNMNLSCIECGAIKDLAPAPAWLQALPIAGMHYWD